MSALIWFRQDLRIEDNPALTAAVRSGRPVYAAYILSSNERNGWSLGGASKVWLHLSLKALTEELAKIGIQLILRKGPVLKTLQHLIVEIKAEAVFWNRTYEPFTIARDTGIASKLREEGLQVASYNSALLFEPWEVANKQGRPFQVFTPFWKKCLELDFKRECLPAPSKQKPPNKIKSLSLEELQLLPAIPWDDGIKKAWQPGAKYALKRLHDFHSKALKEYAHNRDYPSLDGISRLSPYLHFGEISPGQIVQELRGSHAEAYIRQLGWREFAHHLLYHFPDTPENPLKAEFSHFPWQYNTERLRAWQKGITGYPLIDAGMRQLWQTGWMHNRARMVAGSFLVKDLLLPWQQGAAWFWDTLVDADLANNTLGWQWVAGCGADAAPYFRIFNPITQSETFDPDGDYIKQWVPELTKMPAKYIHAPWLAPPEIIRRAAVELGKNYPFPIVDHNEARKKALLAFETIKTHKKL